MAEDLSGLVISTGGLAKCLLLTRRRIAQLTQAGVLRHALDEDTKLPLRGRYRLIESLHAYLKYQRGSLGGVSDATEDSYLIARAKRMTALADIEALRLKRVRGQMHHASDVEYLMTSMLTALKSRLLALPTRVSGPLQGKTDQAQIAEILRSEVEAALRELSEYDPRSFERTNAEYLAQVGVGAQFKPGGNGEHDVEFDSG